MKPAAIITADIELRAHTPICRTDDHWEAQAKKIKWLRDLQDKYGGIPILDGGDLFDKKYKTNPSHRLLNWSIENLPKPIFSVPGNHDLPGKNFKNYSNSAMAVLEKAGVVHIEGSWGNAPRVIVHNYPWGEEIKQRRWRKRKHHLGEYHVALVHAMVYKEHPPFPGCDGWKAVDLLNHLHRYDLIVCGHHHANFALYQDGTWLVNPGSLMRNDADQADYKPAVGLWFPEENDVEWVPVPIERGVVSREHIDKVEKKEQRLDAFVEKLGQQTVSGVNFEKNLEEMADGVIKPIRQKVWEYYEGL